MDKAIRTILRNQMVIMEALQSGQSRGTRVYDHLTGSLRETHDLLDEAQAAAAESVSTKMAQARADRGS